LYRQLCDIKSEIYGSGIHAAADGKERFYEIQRITKNFAAKVKEKQMANTKNWLGVLGMTLVLVLAVTACSTPPPIRPALSQTVINIQRSATNLDTGNLYIYVDGKQINQNQPIGKGQTRNLPVSNGFHRIRVMVNSLESDEMQFTVENNSVSFNISTERIGGSKVLLLQPGTE
jgi:hypothetical protein